MKVSNVALAAILTGTVSILGIASTAMAWHPKGVISKQVQNITSGSALSEADSVADAVAAHPGDTLKYVITVKNDGAAKSNGDDDMANTVMTDTLPSGVALTSDPSQRQITANLGTIKPGQSVSKEYLVTVTTNTAETINNTACFTGNSIVNDNPQSGCNSAIVTVTVPETPVVNPTPTTPVAPTVPQTPVELPHTGTGTNVLLASLGLGALVYISYVYRASRRSLTNVLKLDS